MKKQQPDDGLDWKQIATDYRAKNVDLETRLMVATDKLAASEAAREKFRNDAVRADEKARKLDIEAERLRQRGARFEEALDQLLQDHAAALRGLLK